MAEEEKKETPKKPKQKSPLLGAQAKPTVLDNTTKLDIDTDKKLADLIIEAGLSSNLNADNLEEFTAISNSRDQIYQLIDTMAADSSVSAIVRTYAEDACEMADNGHIVWCESDNPKISMFINYLLNVMNVDKKIFSWTSSLIKYGDVYLRLYRESDYKDPFFMQSNIANTSSAKNRLNESLDEDINLNIHKAGDHYSYYIEMVSDPGTMFELTKYGQTFGYVEVPLAEDNNLNNMFQNYLGSQGQQIANYRMKSNDINIYQADDFVHASLDDNIDRYPERVELFKDDEDLKSNTNSSAYVVRRGKSVLYDSYKIWREKSLLENAALLNRITRSSVVRNISVEVGDMGKTQTQATLRRVKELFEQKSAISVGNGMTEYNNPGAMENNIFTATHNGQGAITINAVGGDIEVKNLGDLDWWNNKFYSSYGIPKQFFGWTDDGAGFNGGTSLTILSSVYAKGVKRIQNAMIQALTDAINLFLISKGFKSYLNNFVLKMKAPLTQEEKDYREDLSTRINAISSFQGLFTDIEDKASRLTILKNMVTTLNYGDEIIQVIDKEIEAAKVAKKKAEEEAAAAAAQEASLEAAEAGGGNEAPEKPETGGDEDMDLGMASVATEESFTKHPDGTILVEGPDYSDFANDNLPTPEELDEHRDFTKNN